MSGYDVIPIKEGKGAAVAGATVEKIAHGRDSHLAMWQSSARTSELRLVERGNSSRIKVRSLWKEAAFSRAIFVPKNDC
jgi:hypothetical protein